MMIIIINKEQDQSMKFDFIYICFSFLSKFVFYFKLRDMLKTLVRNRYKDIEDEFKKLDRGSYGELTPDILYDLFKRLVVIYSK